MLESFLNKVAGAREKKRQTRYKCFPVNFVKFSRTPFILNTSGQLLLKITRTNSLNDILSVNNVNALVQVLPLHSFIYILCLAKKHTNNIFLLLREMRNALHLHVFFFVSFFFQPHP